jgi:hypothetical protein
MSEQKSKLSKKEIDELLVKNSELLVEILRESKKRKNINFINANLMQLVHDFERNILSLYN